MRKKTCFVVMGFGKKTDYPTGRVLDLDASYRNMIKPAVVEAGLKCIRADEIVHSGTIDVPMYEQLLTADVVIADISTANPNAFYELGVRHALRPFTTLIIAEEQLGYPFDVNHTVIRRYQHLGLDVGVTAATKFKAEIVKSLKEILAKAEDDSPVYTFLKGLRPPLREAEKKAARKRMARALAAKGGGRAARAGTKAAAGSRKAAARARPTTAAGGGAQETLSKLMKKADEAQAKGAFAVAAEHLAAARKMMKPKDGREEDPYFIQRLALVTYKSKQPTPKRALEKARSLLLALKPESSNDTETLGLWGAVHKRLWEETGGKAHLDEAIRGYERGFYLRNDYYNGINLAYLFNVRAANSSGGHEAVADFIRAQHVRREVIQICQQWLDTEKPRGRKVARDSEYWVLATLAEAYLGIGDNAQHKKWLKKAYAIAPAQWMRQSTQEQIEKLEKLLAAPPAP